MDNSVVMNKRRKEFTITWFIENYSYCWHEKGQSLNCPEFIADSFENSVWTLILFPRGTSPARAGNISLYLQRTNTPAVLPQKFEMAFLGTGGKSVLHSIEKEYMSNTMCGYGDPHFFRIDEVLSRQNTSCLQNDTLILRCRIWKDEETIRNASQCFARTRFGTEKVSFLHKVKYFSEFKPTEKNSFQMKIQSKSECIISSSIYFSDVWSLNGALIVEISTSDEKYLLRKLRISLRDRYENFVECCEVDNRFDETVKKIQKVHLSLTNETILERKSDYLPNDELSLVCECSFSTGLEFEKIEEIQRGVLLTSSQQSLVNPSNKYGYNAAEKLSGCTSALDDLKTIYFNQCFSDVVLKTETKSFPAHKVVLSARSSVFSTMLTCDMKEKSTNCIQVDDLENDTLEKLLLFLYSENIENLQWESAMKLYYAADKYEIKKLKVLCSSYLVDNLSLSTVCELLLLADTHSDSVLKKAAECFILQHKEKVFSSEEWVKLIETNPKLVSMTMCLNYTKKN